MTIDFYYTLGCSSCRSVMMTAKAIGIDLNLKQTNLMNGEHMTPEFLKMNPQHCVPTLDDNGFVIWESRAILCYLVDKYAKNDSLYPKTPKKRALVDMRLYFDLGTLYHAFGGYYYPMMFAGAAADPAKYAKIEEAFTLLDKFLEGETWVAGKFMTIADLSIVATVTTTEAAGFDISKYPNVTKWLNKAKKTIGDYEAINHAGCLEFKQMFDHLMSAKE